MDLSWRVFLLETRVEDKIIMLLPKRVKYRRQHRPKDNGCFSGW